MSTPITPDERAAVRKHAEGGNSLWPAEALRLLDALATASPAWDEEAMRAASQVLYERLTRIPEFARLDSHVQSDYSNTLARAVLAVVRDHLQ